MRLKLQLILQTHETTQYNLSSKSLKNNISRQGTKCVFKKILFLNISALVTTVMHKIVHQTTNYLTINVKVELGMENLSSTI